MQTLASNIIPDPVTRLVKHGYSWWDGCGSGWKTGLIVGVTTGASAIAGTYVLFRLANYNRKVGSKSKNCNLSSPAYSRTRNGTACKPLLSCLPVTSKARTALEFEEMDAALVTPAEMYQEAVDGSCYSRSSFRPTDTSTPDNRTHNYPNRSDDSAICGTTTLMISSKSSPFELLLYGFESLKRSIRLFEEARNKMVLSEGLENFGSFSRENSIDCELEFILSKAKQLQDDLDSYIKESFPGHNTSVHADNSADRTLIAATLGKNDLLSDDSASIMSSASHHQQHLSPPISRSLMHRSDSNISLATTITMPFYDIEPNVHFFKLYTEALDHYSEILAPRTDRWQQLNCESHEEFVAKVHCLRLAFGKILSDEDNKMYFAELGEQVLHIVLHHSPKDPSACLAAYQEMLDYVSHDSNSQSILDEIASRKIACNSFYDLVLDYVILESFDDLDNPPSAVTSVANNRWLSTGFRELALQTAVSAVLRHKRSKLPIKNGFFDHFYNILEHVLPILAWGFLGSDVDLKLTCHLIRDAVNRLCQSIFSFDKVRYTSINDLCDDVLRVTHVEFDLLKRQLNAGR